MVGKIDFQGDLLEDKDKLLEKLEDSQGAKSTAGRSLQADLTTLSDLYADQGYANADIAPLIKENDRNPQGGCDLRHPSRQ